MQDEECLLSIVIPAYNVAGYIESTLSALLNQTIQSYEIIIVDDCSTDGSYELIARIAKENPRIRVFRNDENHGSGYSRNRGIEKSRGKYVTSFDADDYVEPDYYERLISAAQKHKAQIACANIMLRFEDGRDIPQSLLTDNCILKQSSNVRNQIRLKKYLYKKGYITSFFISGRVAIGHWSSAASPTKVFKRELLMRYPYFVGECDDIPAILPALAEAQRITYVPDLFYYYVQRTGSQENSEFRDKRIGIANSISLAASRILNNNGNPVFLKCLVRNHLYPTIINFLRSVSPSQRERVFVDFFQRLKECEGISPYMDSEKNEFILQAISELPQTHQYPILKIISCFCKGDIKGMEEIVKLHKGIFASELPKVSIIIPVYNGSNYMKEAIASALGQDYPNVEVIVVNDGSKDQGETERIAKSYGERIRYFSKPNGGVATALNLGIEKMTGDYFSWLSHDDLYKPEKISKQIEIVMQQEDPRTVIAGGYELFNETGIIGHIDPLGMHPKEKLEKPLYPVFYGLLNGCTMLIHKSHFERVGMFNPNLPTTQDYDMWFRILRGQKVVFQNGLYVRSRCHEEQGSRKLFHMEECFNLWKYMMDAVTEEECRTISGSPYQFYRDVYDFLRIHTPYDLARRYAHAKAICYALSTIDSLEKPGQLYPIPGLEAYKQSFAYSKMLKPRGATRVVFVSIENVQEAQKLAASFDKKWSVVHLLLSTRNDKEPKLSYIDSVFTLPLQSVSSDSIFAILKMLNPDLVIYLFGEEAIAYKHMIYHAAQLNFLSLRKGAYVTANFDKTCLLFDHLQTMDFAWVQDIAAKQLYGQLYSNMLRDDDGDFARKIDVLLNVGKAAESKIFVKKNAETLVLSSETVKSLLELCGESSSVSTTNYHAQYQNTVDVCRRCSEMEKTVSWRITKPLRMIRALQKRIMRT